VPPRAKGATKADGRHQPRGSDRAHHRRDHHRLIRRMNDSTSTDLQRAIEARTHGLVGQVLSLQAFWVLAAALLAAVTLSFATEAFATHQNLFNLTRTCPFV